MHADIRGFNEKDSEFHYGLLMRDGVAKPGLLAYATIAKALDGAKFIKKLSYGKNQLQVLHFSTGLSP